MELKDMILSTLAELEEQPSVEIEKKEPKEETKSHIKEESTKKPESRILKPLSEIEKAEESESSEEEKNIELEKSVISDERAFCESTRERILVLFEGFQSPNNKNIEAKIDLTLNFLEYLLAVIDERLEKLDSKGK